MKTVIYLVVLTVIVACALCLETNASKDERFTVNDLNGIYYSYKGTVSEAQYRTVINSMYPAPYSLKEQSNLAVFFKYCYPKGC
ncbi:Uncharacterised protein [uncultured archaeon]|nr:Uncharacterised protein [uncultured archaeon]